MSSVPLVSVIMPVYNGELYLREAIESILKQTFLDFEFIIINDGSNDNTADIIGSYQDKRIVYLKNDVNLGVVESLNIGLDIAKGVYIARMDADDISFPNRLEKQLLYLDSHPEVGLLGSWAEWTDEKGNFLFIGATPLQHNLITWRLLFGNCFTHSSVIFRRVLLPHTGFYLQRDVLGEDYGLWLRMGRVTKMANLPEVLLKKRLNKRGVGMGSTAEQEKIRIKIMQQAVSSILGMDVATDSVALLCDVATEKKFKSFPKLKTAVNLINSLYLKFIYKVPLTTQEKRQIELDAVASICNMAYNNLNTSLPGAISAFYGAFKISPRVTIMFIFKKIQSNILRIIHKIKRTVAIWD